jgi:glucose-1-phosphate thymidylyltransferase
MKGIILAGGRATRLRPLTLVASKQLLPVYDRPMIYYPINTLVSAGIKDILIVIAPDYSGLFLNLLGTGEQFGVRFSYVVQKEPRGLPEAFVIGADFIANDSVAMILGDNIFDHSFSQDLQDFQSGALVFAKKVPDPERYGVVELDSQNNVLSLEEKPQNPKSDQALVGLYVFDHQVAGFAKSLAPSARGETEITDLMRIYLQQNQLKAKTFEGYWQDAGTFDSLLDANTYMSKKKNSL